MRTPLVRAPISDLQSQQPPRRKAGGENQETERSTTGGWVNSLSRPKIILLRLSHSEIEHKLLAQEEYEARFYSNYRKVAEEYDREFLKKYDEDLNTCLIFVSTTRNFIQQSTNYGVRAVCLP